MLISYTGKNLQIKIVWFKHTDHKWHGADLKGSAGGKGSYLSQGQTDVIEKHVQLHFTFTTLDQSKLTRNPCFKL